MGAARRTAAPRLVADIGGTNARFALQPVDGAPGSLRVLTCADYPTLAAAARDYLDAVSPPRRPRRAALAVASPVVGDRVDMTNHPWSFSIAGLKHDLGLDILRVINDFTAIALAVPALGAADIRKIGGGAPAEPAPLAVLGPGTGLGVSGLVPVDGGWRPLSGEGGHATLAAADEREAAVVAVLRRRFGHVSAERAVSGPGLVNLYAALAGLDGVEPETLGPDDITARAAAGSDPACAAALDMFCAMLGTVAADLALTLGARAGVYVAGGIVPKLGGAFDASPFRARFEDKGRFRAYLAAIPTYVVTRDQPALLGLATLLDDGARDRRDG